VLTISEKFNDYGKEVANALTNAGLRPSRISGRRKSAQDPCGQHAENSLPTGSGEQEREGQKVAVRQFPGGDKGQMSLEEFIQRCDQEVSSRGGAPVTAPV